MNIKTILFAFLFFSGCSPAKLSVPPSFSSQATKLPVKGLNGWMVKQKLAFGPYKTSVIKRGWDFSSSVQYTRFRISPEEAILKVFNIDIDKRNLNQRNKFHYTLQDGKGMAEIYATEKFSEKQLVYKSNNPYIGNASKTIQYEYAFTAAIVPITTKPGEPWSLVLINRYDATKDANRNIFKRPYVEEEGFATNGKETIAIRPLHMEQIATKKANNRKLFGGKVLSGYELQWHNRAGVVIDLFNNSIWLDNNLEPSEKLLLSSVASAILLKRLQDVEKDRAGPDM